MITTEQAQKLIIREIKQSECANCHGSMMMLPMGNENFKLLCIHCDLHIDHRHIRKHKAS